ncbi:YebC/PmpR family DNA-binding transcriptional regulator [Aliikangiella coralliicola]|uniref:Probable transcriptional regulatory protein FLL46_14090 n=1 Tax=Aliikangiella coralliicola TaxID=2592383 RepID=A0A545UBU9_9GAMM|nr:YebC/PmpR family DNA-binding transcriptional regulator [Aliikangiella coralliicola]TQV86940.1 YebC/PmpR family DNA-binding transcriptional regulator [Aliikangiella coralliicola]
MAGHSKWANIKHRKAAQDAKRGKIFTKIIREIVVAAKSGGPNPEDNPSLRAVIDKALGANMKRDTIDKAIARGAGNAEGDNYENLTYEGYGPGGVAILVECLTDNKNRTVAEVRHAFTKAGSELAASGSVAYLFERKGQMVFSSGVDEDQLMEEALEAGADDIVNHEDGSFEVLTTPEDFLTVKEALQEKGLKPEAGEVSMIPATQAELDVDTAVKVLKLIDRLDDLDDTQNVYSNADIPPEAYEQL